MHACTINTQVHPNEVKNQRTLPKRTPPILYKSTNALALCHPLSASLCSVLAGQWSSRIFTHDKYNILSDILTEFEVNPGIIIEKKCLNLKFANILTCIIH